MKVTQDPRFVWFFILYMNISLLQHCLLKRLVIFYSIAFDLCLKKSVSYGNLFLASIASIHVSIPHQPNTVLITIDV